MNSKIPVTVFGRLGADPELKYTQNQKAVCSFSIAEKVNGEESPRWHRVVVWGKQGEDCKLHLSKGRQVFVQGQINSRAFVHNGDDRTQDELTAEFIGIPLPKEQKNASN